MSQSERIAFIAQVLNDGKPLTAQMLCDKFEVSRATAMRDIEFLRGRINMPIDYDAASRSYRLGSELDGSDAGRPIAGLWLNASEAYAFLTLFNITRELDPGVLRPFLLPFHKVIKRFLNQTGMDLKGFDRKIRIDIPFDPPLDPHRFIRLTEAVAQDTPLQVKGTRPDGQPFDGPHLVQGLVLRLDGWWARLSREDLTGGAFEINAQDVEVMAG